MEYVTLTEEDKFLALEAALKAKETEHFQFTCSGEAENNPQYLELLETSIGKIAESLEAVKSNLDTVDGDAVQTDEDGNILPPHLT